MVAVAEVQLGEQRQAADDEAQRRVGDVQAGQTQLLHVAQLALVVQLTCRRGGGQQRRSVTVSRWMARSNPQLNQRPGRQDPTHPRPEADAGCGSARQKCCYCCWEGVRDTIMRQAGRHLACSFVRINMLFTSTDLTYPAAATANTHWQPVCIHPQAENSHKQTGQQNGKADIIPDEQCFERSHIIFFQIF